MMIQVNKINEDGYILEPVVVNEMDVLQADLISLPVPDGLYIPKWQNRAWVEGATEEYKFSVDNPKKEPSELETLRKVNAELKSRLESTELAVVTLMDFM
ncbi:hypothetical protein M3204_03450 [Mesobacillus subterraneus]|uniref:hypothetical protein n=1 Tax=Mesobacillus subterraneus TaxID=285983 RepID=UPI0020413829|nr:hypothetical protein [Mesobacillus subterraneus]MCM3663445.1 hypothetical protein [Mesobacillus subterraneus]MCM3683215.1 hypothetical protein [Mesobacillus subterraneus]